MHALGALEVHLEEGQAAGQVVQGLLQVSAAALVELLAQRLGVPGLEGDQGAQPRKKST